MSLITSYRFISTTDVAHLKEKIKDVTDDNFHISDDKVKEHERRTGK